MGKNIFTTAEDLRQAEIHSKEDERMFHHLEDMEIESWRIDDMEYCESMARQYLWPSPERLQQSCRRVMEQKSALRIIERDGELPLAHELTSIQIKIWKPQAENLMIEAKKYNNVCPVRASEILRRYYADHWRTDE